MWEEGAAKDILDLLQDSLKGGSIIRMRTKISKPRPLLTITTPIFARFGEQFLAPPWKSSRFRSRFLLEHAKVSHRSSFLSSLAREGGST